MMRARSWRGATKEEGSSGKVHERPRGEWRTLNVLQVVPFSTVLPDGRKLPTLRNAARSYRKPGM